MQNRRVEIAMVEKFNKWKRDVLIQRSEIKGNRGMMGRAKNVLREICRSVEGKRTAMRNINFIGLM